MKIFILSLLVILFDQVTKAIIVNTMTVNQSVPVIRNVFHITYVRNFGAAFGIFSHRIGFFVVVALAVALFIIFFMAQIPAGHRLLRVALALQLGGAVGNLIDRVRYGYVVDFFDFRIWPVFNIADIAIVTGIGLMVLDLVLSGREKGR